MKHSARTQITWFFRKSRALGNFSIENSFRAMRAVWGVKESPTVIRSRHFSNGILNRIRIILEARRISSDVLHITGDIHFAALAWPHWSRNRPKVVLSIHDIGFLEEHARMKKWVMKLFWLDLPLRCIDELIVVSPATKIAVKHALPWFSENQISVIPTVVPQHFNRRRRTPEKERPIALHIGLAQNKNLHGHARALEGLNIHLRIIGKPSEQEHALLKALNIDYSCASRLSDEEMQNEYANADFVLFVSTLEGFGMPIIEANIVGVPVITSDLEPMKSVAGEAALLCNPLDVSSIRTAIQRITVDESLRDRLVQNGFENAKRFSPEKSAQLHQELYNKLIHAQP